jgi:hypothetical protein
VALIIIKGDDGMGHLVHTSQIRRKASRFISVFDADGRRPARAVGDWWDVWDRIDQEKGKI